MEFIAPSKECDCEGYSWTSVIESYPFWVAKCTCTGCGVVLEVKPEDTVDNSIVVIPPSIHEEHV